jgi:hypothetical protein
LPRGFLRFWLLCPVLTWGRWKGNMTLTETSRRNLVGNQSHSAESGQRPKASLAWSSATAAAKRRQRRCRTMLLSPEITVVGVLAFSHTGDRGEASKWPDAFAPAGVAGAWCTSTEVPQEQERPALSARRFGSQVAPKTKRPGPRLGAAGRRERNDAAQLAVSLSEPNKLGEKERQESECLHSTEIHWAATLADGPRGAN